MTWGPSVDKDQILQATDFAALYARELPGFRLDRKAGEAWALCPFHSDQNPDNLHLRLDDGAWYCHVCKEGGDAFTIMGKVWGTDFKDTLNRLAERAGIRAATSSPSSPAAAKVKQLGRIVATYDYQDAEETLLFQVVRYEPKRFLQRRPDGKGGWVYKRVYDEVRPVLYRLPEIILPDTEHVFLVEGEKDADNLRRLGLRATCNPMGAGKWDKSFNFPLKGKRVTILPDNDQAGRDHARAVAESLHGTAARVEIVELPGLPEKGDVSDWLGTPGNDREALLQLAEAVSPWTPPVPVAPEAEGGRSRKRRDPASSSSLEHKEGRGIERLLPMMDRFPLLRDGTGKTYIEVDKRLQPLDTRNPELTSYLLYLYYTVTGKHISKEAVNATVMILSAKARQEAPLIELFNRVGERDGSFYHDLKNGRAVELSPGVWRITEAAPVYWHTFNHQQPQPDPQKGGSLWRFFDFCNVPEEARLLVAVVIVSCFIPRISHPALHITGCQGSGKSFFSKLLKHLIDPSTAVLLTLPRKDEDFDLLLFRHHFVPLDNLSDLSPALSDRLCNVISGAILEKRLLFTDTDTALLPCNPVIAFNGITPLIKRADLLDRSITITLDRITPGERREERELWQAFEEAAPSILGGVFDTLARAMEIFPDVRLKSLPRLADFARWGFVIAEALGGRGNEFLKGYADNSAMQTADLHEQNTFLQAIVTRMEGTGHLEGNFREVLSILTELAAPGKNDRSFPSSPRSFRGHLERIRVPLGDMGITFTMTDPHDRTNKGRIVRFEKSSTAPEAAAWGNNGVSEAEEPDPF